MGQTDDATVVFNINITPNFPVFINAPYSVGSISENIAVGAVVYNLVLARDADLQVGILSSGEVGGEVIKVFSPWLLIADVSHSMGPSFDLNSALCFVF